MAGLDGFDVHSHLAHHLHAVCEGECDTLLCGTYDVCLSVDIEIDAVNACARILILQHSLSSVAKRYHAQPLGTYRHRLGQVVHLGIADTLRCYGSLYPCVQYARAVNAEQHAEARHVCRIVHVGKGIHAALWVIVHIAQDAINHS